MASRSRSLTVPVAVALFGMIAFSGTARCADTNPSVGKWKLNIAKSKFEPGPVLKSEMRTYEDWGGGLVHAVFEGVDAQDKPTFREYVGRFDEKDYPYVRRGSPTASTIGFKSIDARTFWFVVKEDGKVSYTGTHTRSADGAVLTVTAKGVSAQGQPIGYTLVYDKQ
ncbi:MAG: hypothetical protein ACHQQS_07805 [Thermoanaerobaculales bacterium]